MGLNYKYIKAVSFTNNISTIPNMNKNLERGKNVKERKNLCHKVQWLKPA